MNSCSWLDRICAPWRTPPKLKISNAEKPGSNETIYCRIHVPSKTRKVISSVTRHQRRPANPSLRTLRESLGDHYGPRHRYRHVLDLCMHNHMRIPALNRCRCNVPIVDPRLRRSVAIWHPSRPTRAGQYPSPRLYSDRIGRVIRRESTPDDYYTGRL